MAEYERANQQKQEEAVQKHHLRREKSEPLFALPQAFELGAFSLSDTPFQPPVERHATWLAGAHSYEQRANLVVHLQQSYGNAYVQRLLESRAVQVKLTINAPNDVYEQEADRVAETVTRAATPPLQRQVEEEEEEEVQAKFLGHTQGAAKSAVPAVGSGMEERINAARRGGELLPDQLRGPMEQAFGADFSGVRVHTDSDADALNQSLRARAFTTGHDVFFRGGEYSPMTLSGRQLIAHELTHVVQQGGAGTPANQVQREGIPPPVQALISQAGTIQRAKKKRTLVEEMVRKHEPGY